MEIEQALKIYEQLIEATMAQGFFKKLDQIDLARNSYNTIVEHLKSKNDETENSPNEKEKS